MRIYSSFKEAYQETHRELFEMGTDVKVQSMQNKKGELETKELVGYGFMITSQANASQEFEELGGNLKYVETEFLERISPYYINPGKSWMERKDVWERFLDPQRKMDYTYNERYRTQITKTIQELRDNPGTRQAIMTVYDHHQDLNNWGGKARIPCSLTYQFLRRQVRNMEVLHCIYTMRSCDALTHLLYDMLLTMRLQGFIANSVGIEPGTYTHFIGSLHAYKIDMEKMVIF